MSGDPREQQWFQQHLSRAVVRGKTASTLACVQVWSDFSNPQCIIKTVLLLSTYLCSLNSHCFPNVYAVCMFCCPLMQCYFALFSAVLTATCPWWNYSVVMSQFSWNFGVLNAETFFSFDNMPIHAWNLLVFFISASCLMLPYCTLAICQFIKNLVTILCVVATLF